MAGAQGQRRVDLVLELIHLFCTMFRKAPSHSKELLRLCSTAAAVTPPASWLPPLSHVLDDPRAGRLLLLYTDTIRK